MVAQLSERIESSAARRSTTAFLPAIRATTDLVLTIVGFIAAYYLRYIWQIGGEVAPEDFRPLRSFIPLVALLAAILIAVYTIRGLYHLPRWTSFLDEASIVISGALTGFSVLIVLVFYARQLYFSRLIFLYALGIVVLLLLARRLASHALHAAMRARGRWVDRVLVIGAGPAARRIMGALIGQPQLGYEVVGFVEDTPLPSDWAVATQRAVVRPRHLGAYHNFDEVIRLYDIDEVIVALQPTAHEQLLWALERCRRNRVPFTLVPDLFELSLDRIEIYQLNGLPLISVKDGGIRGLNFALKRVFDVVLATVFLVAALIPVAIIAVLIKLDTPGPLFLRQTRIGRGGRAFTCYKFRSMHKDADRQKELLARSQEYRGDQVMFKLRDDPRRTRVGRWLRRTSLDELPQLFNIIRGDMSLVGPRPAVPEEVAKYEPWHRQRLDAMPGLTGLWQVNGRSNLSFDEMVRLDLYYAEHWSLWLDLKILLRTIPAVLTARGAY